MSRSLWRYAPRTAAAANPARRGAVAFSALAAVAVMSPFARYPAIPQPPPGGGAPVHTQTQHTATAGAFRRIVLPDVVVIARKGLRTSQVAALRRLAGVRALQAVDGAAITVGGHRVNVIGADPQRFRSWTPLGTASDQRLWPALASGGFIASVQARDRLRLRPGEHYRLAGASTVDLGYGGAGRLGIAGIDLVVSNQFSGRLGLIHNVAAMISAPGVPMTRLRHRVQAVLGSSGTVISVRQHPLPVDRTPSGRPTSYLQLFRESAARYCPGLSWTVLAAIGQIESADGANNGPSTAGALGPMQFLPSTWRVWGITGFGEPGPPSIMDAFDAVPSAARYLCAAGAATPGGLRGAVFAYNHAGWYVDEVLALAEQYARVYG